MNFNISLWASYCRSQQWGFTTWSIWQVNVSRCSCLCIWAVRSISLQDLNCSTADALNISLNAGPSGSWIRYIAGWRSPSGKFMSNNAYISYQSSWSCIAEICTARVSSPRHTLYPTAHCSRDKCTLRASRDRGKRENAAVHQNLGGTYVAFSFFARSRGKKKKKRYVCWRWALAVVRQPLAKSRVLSHHHQRFDELGCCEDVCALSTNVDVKNGRVGELKYYNWMSTDIQPSKLVWFFSFLFYIDSYLSYLFFFFCLNVGRQFFPFTISTLNRWSWEKILVLPKSFRTVPVKIFLFYFCSPSK